MQRIALVACSCQVPYLDWNPQLQLQVSCSSRDPLGSSSWLPVVLSISVLWDSELCKKLDFPRNPSVILLLQLNPCANLKQSPHTAVNYYPVHATFHIHMQVIAGLESAFPFTCTSHTDVSLPSLAVRKSLKREDPGWWELSAFFPFEKSRRTLLGLLNTSTPFGNAKARTSSESSSVLLYMGVDGNNLSWAVGGE